MCTEQAKAKLRKYRIFKLLVSLIALTVYIVVAFSGNGIAIILTLLFAMALIRFAPMVLFRKYITGTLIDQLDAPLYQEIVKEGKIYVPSALWQLQGEYFSGNYQNVISICNQQLEVEKLAKKYKYYYLVYLATTYFDLGDQEKLKDTCETFNQNLTNEKNKERILRRIPRMVFFNHYIRGNFDACSDYLYKPQAQKINQVYRTYCQARIALLKEDIDEAKKLFESVLQTAPKLNYAILAAHGIEAIEKGIPYQDTFESIIVATDFLIPEVSKKNKILKIIRLVAGIILIGCVVAYSGVSAFMKMQDKAYENDLAAYREGIRILVEENYDSVEILDTFNLKKDGQIVDSMFLCKTDESILLGCLYSYRNDEKQYYDVKYEMPFSDLEKTHSPLMYLTFQCTTSEYYVYSYFYTSKDELPSEYHHLSAITVDGKTVYFAVTEIDDQPSI